MINITIELIPFGVITEKKTLATIAIVNNGTGTSKTGNYDYMLSKQNLPKSIWKTGKVFNFKRKRHNVYKLLQLVLKDVLREKNV